MARPSKYTPERAKRITDALAAGNSRKGAAAYASITEDTLLNWMRRYSDFSGAVKSAEAQAEVAAVACITQAARNGDWRAALTWLERRRHQEWGRVDRLELEIRETAERVAAQTGADADWLVKRAAEIAAAARVGQAS
jgi:transposase